AATLLQRNAGTVAIGGPRVNEESVANRFPPQQHAESHRIAIRQRKLDHPGLLEYLSFRLDHRPLRRVTAGTPYSAVPQQWRLRPDDRIGVLLQRMDFKSHKVFASS